MIFKHSVFFTKKIKEAYGIQRYRMVCWLLAFTSLLLSACTILTPPTSTSQEILNNAVRSAPLILLGEVHDNVTQHAMRFVAFKALLATGKRPALLMEQFDREHQPAIHAVRARLGKANAAETAEALIAMVNSASLNLKSGWNWDFYQPFLILAVQYDLPIIAANVSRQDLRKVMQEGLSALGLSAVIPPKIATLQQSEIQNGHCNQLPTNVVEKMVVAQIARDLIMARFLKEHIDRGAVLLAGNGHTRKDIGVKHWLSQEIAAKTVSIGMLENSSPDSDLAEVFDHIVKTIPQPRLDPCTAFKVPSPVS